ncbi:MAG: DUF932 domain-containing protein [Candidatus Jettenia sp.]|uniref:DUF932 domain-containing protein n=1 Tax=Candidatus Jettenia caeni TaxID=247490 RepID=I3IJD2_9BACT|nr:DUF932 domain-containing protein [Candidatus Jettenia sp. AMX1]MBC6928882.1 DUF932 domain-containing protein [Candidatus Jettenia sp.]GAB61827.1 conserved hypothetical protein [Candidatus Jettenia caeni]KAA0250874.1 MAG: DUF932 domain-containing protein [Candidatus Jettenia sp. AMX1]MCE7879883.1 DUF932 domain-containing protein [Candidatus Jettenia sp. AMX1]MCQ3926662.1 DUF932 domain-containing protein [Candidatus Jettenia sp.]
MVTNLLTASHQWRNRPADERFTTVEDLKNAVMNRRSISYEGVVEVQKLSISPGKDAITLAYDHQHLDVTHWSFNQLCQLAGAPASYLRTLPGDLVAQNLNYALPGTRQRAKLLLTVNGSTEVRAFTSESYGRIWDIDVVRAVEGLCERNPSWHNPPAYKRKDSDGREMENAGLYASDRDIFLFLIDEDHHIEVGKEVLSRGFFIWNSEVGKSSFGLTTFLYRYVCGNHIVWGAHEVKEIRIKHSLNAPARAFSEIIPALSRYIESSANVETQTMKKAMEYRPARDKEGTIDWLQKNGFTKAVSEKAFDYAVKEEGNGTSLWNIVQGLSAMARDKTHIDQRVDLERQAGRLLDSV